RLRHGLPLYTAPSPDWMPFIYPPGYSAVVAALGVVAGDVSPGLARSVSIAGSLAAALAVVYAGGRLGRSWAGGVLGACFFLLTYADSGAFMDLVRPDGLATGLLAWALVLGLERDRRATVASGLLLAASFTVKQHAAAFGIPMALGIWADRGWREGLRFGIASAGPALAYVALMELVSGGWFLVWVVDVAGAHPLVMERWYPGTMGEVGRDLPWLVLFTTVAMVAGTAKLQRSQAARVAVVAAAVLVGWLSLGVGQEIVAVYELFGTTPQFRTAPRLDFGARTFWVAQGAGVGAGLAGLAGFALQRRVPGRWAYGMGVALVAFVLGGVMRAHHGGYLNVYIPIHLVLAIAVAVAIGKLRAWRPGLLVAVLTLVPVLVQLRAEDADRFDPATYVPDAADVEAGMEFVEALRACDAPVLAPIDPWMAVMAGHTPAWHLMGLWDIDHPRGPIAEYAADVDVVVHEQRWSCVVMGDAPMRHGFRESYTEAWRPATGGGRSLRPRTGWPARPSSIWKPIPRGPSEPGPSGG
ncbi:MAG: hypothetical protein KC656_23345, partial [Myxococcales bacterium]|nr:hypothetical protein [Myxococcales bacterium]